MASSLDCGATSVHSNRYPFSIQAITSALRSNERQNSLKFWTLPVAIAPCPVGPHGMSNSSTSSALS